MKTVNDHCDFWICQARSSLSIFIRMNLLCSLSCRMVLILYAIYAIVCVLCWPGRARPASHSHVRHRMMCNWELCPELVAPSTDRFNPTIWSTCCSWVRYIWCIRSYRSLYKLWLSPISQKYHLHNICLLALKLKSEPLPSHVYTMLRIYTRTYTLCAVE